MLREGERTLPELRARGGRPLRARQRLLLPLRLLRLLRLQEEDGQHPLRRRRQESGTEICD